MLAVDYSKNAILSNRLRFVSGIVVVFSFVFKITNKVLQGNKIFAVFLFIPIKRKEFVPMNSSSENKSIENMLRSRGIVVFGSGVVAIAVSIGMVMVVIIPNFLQTTKINIVHNVVVIVGTTVNQNIIFYKHYDI